MSTLSSLAPVMWVLSKRRIRSGLGFKKKEQGTKHISAWNANLVLVTSHPISENDKEERLLTKQQKEKPV